MPAISKAETRDLFGGYQDAIRNIFFGAWSDWSKTDYPGTWRCKRSRANFVWEQIIARAHAQFLQDERVHIIRKNESYVFLLDGVVAFRFKKSDELGMTANIPTQAVLEFHDPECELPGLPQVSRVDIVYIINNLETAIADILVVGRDKSDITWTFSLLEDKAAISLPSRLPSAVPQDNVVKARPSRRLVRPKAENGKADKDADGQA